MLEIPPSQDMLLCLAIAWFLVRGERAGVVGVVADETEDRDGLLGGEERMLERVATTRSVVDAGQLEVFQEPVVGEIVREVGVGGGTAAAVPAPALEQECGCGEEGDEDADNGNPGFCAEGSHGVGCDLMVVELL
ncbi:hypothetical protein Micbo1qcDRAFT_216112 [Microdochium bolleyi]|uniref:Uncharacterized protein n=1 Tax=Microdochium bolleyi TaxID=196109 RepID=A0A136IRM2_9PEZI|nr:hypothetical protein Micbo1qcDRAFT_216112 [Microdochium bolleyi]